MATKVKVVREYTFKAYSVNSSEVKPDVHSGEFFYKSDCHYYCEKEVLDRINSERKECTFAIWQVSTVEDSKIADKLIEIIDYDGEKVTIKQ